MIPAEDLKVAAYKAQFDMNDVLVYYVQPFKYRYTGDQETSLQCIHVQDGKVWLLELETLDYKGD